MYQRAGTHSVAMRQKSFFYRTSWSISTRCNPGQLWTDTNRMAVRWISTFWDNTCWTPKGHRYFASRSHLVFSGTPVVPGVIHTDLPLVDYWYFLVTCNVYKQNLFLSVHLLFCRTIAPHVNKRGLLQGRKCHLWVWAFYTLNRQPSTLYGVWPRQEQASRDWHSSEIDSASTCLISRHIYFPEHHRQGP